MTTSVHRGSYPASAQCSQAHLQQDGMAGLRISAVSVVGHVVQRRHKTVVDITDANARLVERVGDKIITYRTQRGPVGGELDRRRGENALAPFQESDLRLRRIAAIEHREPETIKCRAALNLQSLHRKIAFGEAETRYHVVDRIRLVGEPSHVVRARCIKSAG